MTDPVDPKTKAKLDKLQAIVDDRLRRTYGTVQAMRDHPAFFKPVERKAPRRGC